MKLHDGSIYKCKVNLERVNKLREVIIGNGNN